MDAELDVSQRGTYYYHQENRWNALDHILIAEGSDILKGAPSLRYVSGSVRVSKSPFQNRDGHPQGCETFGRGSPRTSCPNGASDHLPVVADFAL